MDLNSNKLYITSFLLISSVIFLAHAKLELNLDRSDYNAFKIIQTDLGIYKHHPSFTTTPCNSPAISCEHRVSNYMSLVLEVTRIAYDSEQLGGFISSKIGQLRELKELTLTNNHLIGQLPQEIVDCRKLQVLNLRNNLFSGNVPSELSKLVLLRVLDLSDNRFTGDLSFLKYFPKLEKLSLANNLFSGIVPSSLRSFHNLRLLDISGNNHIQGPVPDLDGVEYISSLPRRYMIEQNSTRNNQSSTGRVEGPAQAPSPSVVLHNEHESTKKLVTWLLGLAIGVGIGFFSGVTISVFVKVGLALVRLWRTEESFGVSLFSPLIQNAEDLAFLEKDDGLSGLQVIGKGGCGEVYKAVLPGSDGRIIAIKKIIQSPEAVEDIDGENSKVLDPKMRQVRAEIQTIGRLRHSNVLPLLAHVSRPDCHYLVYEFVKNGSLHDKMVEMEEGNTSLDWLARYRVALGVATGLEYLHINNKPRIIHRDLKPGNILLDDDMEARISDFGLAKEMPNEKTHVSTNVVGTHGYIAPEYHQTFRYTEKCDMYSFGVILGSLVIGKLPSDLFFQETDEIHLVTWMRNIMSSEDPTKALDPALRGNGYEEQMLQVLKIACFCTVEDPKERPNSRDVRSMLSQINHQVSGISDFVNCEPHVHSESS
ncbi:leucine-rich repeat receptor-like serine/threonine/tyrosine-protein kinase SOBIR1 [Silene latifolia]|uniref:leucine-rich repeat receptor-like serine/threonine/tyrosine-protein kinase SOBIR1 n=1 Tax=Silene latifolia TaxID=37657 RepID=UPI003D786E67